MNKHKNIITYLILSALLLANSLLLDGVASSLRGIYYIDMSFLNILLFWCAWICLLIALFHLFKEAYQFILKYFNNLNHLKNK